MEERRKMLLEIEIQKSWDSSIRFVNLFMNISNLINDFLGIALVLARYPPGVVGVNQLVRNTQIMSSAVQLLKILLRTVKVMN